MLIFIWFSAATIPQGVFVLSWCVFFYCSRLSLDSALNYQPAFVSDHIDHCRGSLIKAVELNPDLVCTVVLSFTFCKNLISNPPQSHCMVLSVSFVWISARMWPYLTFPSPDRLENMVECLTSVYFHGWLEKPRSTCPCGRRIVESRPWQPIPCVLTEGLAPTAAARADIYTWVTHCVGPTHIVSVTFTISSS